MKNHTGPIMVQKNIQNIQTMIVKTYNYFLFGKRQIKARVSDFSSEVFTRLSLRHFSSQTIYRGLIRRAVSVQRSGILSYVAVAFLLGSRMLSREHRSESVYNLLAVRWEFHPSLKGRLVDAPTVSPFDLFYPFAQKQKSPPLLRRGGGFYPPLVP